ncbi:MAG: glycosyltransferase family 4 protein [Ruminococcus sp.]|nr:glycosyltransferase family 4 protein [Ruminococcus sp.]
MKIWLINHYAVPPQYYPLARPSLFAKNLIKAGHDVTVIAASTVHNSESVNLITDGQRVKRITDDGIPYVLINCTPYQGNGMKRVLNIRDFAKRLPKVLDTLDRPDAAVATSFDPISCYEGIRYAKKHGIKAVAEIADLWPETLVAYKGVSPANPIVKYLRRVEKSIYTQADRIVFTMEGAYDYIKEQGWEHDVPRDKVFYINNGIDLEQFDRNREVFRTEDADLMNSELFKVVYTGAIRRVNNIDKLLDIAKKVTEPRVRFLIWGGGDELERLEERQRSENIDNVVFKGWVKKENIPFITGSADLNLVHNEASPLFRFGISFNKIFDYMAAGRPILCDFSAKYNPVLKEGAGFSVESGDVDDIARKIDELSRQSAQELLGTAAAARSAAKKYDFSVLTSELLGVIAGIEGK